MPYVRLDSAPRPRATAVVITTAAATATQGLSPSVSPFVLPSSATALPMTKPATPYISNWASDTIPPYADRKMSVEAATPRISVRVITNSTKYCEPNAGKAINTTRIATITAMPTDGRRTALTQSSRTSRSGAPRERARAARTSG
jgi:hypothetical protein